MQRMNTACDNNAAAQTIKLPTITFSVEEVMIVLGSSEILLLIIPSTRADATAERTPDTPVNPANKYVCCFLRKSLR